jgi:hypothetical protein
LRIDWRYRCRNRQRPAPRRLISARAEPGAVESNPLGARVLYLGSTRYRIHGTNQPSTIGSFEVLEQQGTSPLTDKAELNVIEARSVGSR